MRIMHTYVALLDLSRVCCGVEGQWQLNTFVSKVCRCVGVPAVDRARATEYILLLGPRGVALFGVPLTRLTERSDPSNRRNRATMYTRLLTQRVELGCVGVRTTLWGT